MSAREQPSSLRLAGTMAVGALISGLILAGAQLGTAPAIEKNRAEALRKAIFKVVPGTTKIRPHALRGDKLVALDENAPSNPKEERVYEGLGENGQSLGFAIPGAGPGFQDTIALLYGFDPKRGVVIGLEVLESRETPGLGDKIGFDPAFLKNFEALEVAPQIDIVKHGAKSAPNQVDAITGATISSKAVVKILNTTTGRWQPLLKQASPSGKTALAEPGKAAR